MKDETIENLKLAGAIISVVIHATEDKEKVKELMFEKTKK
jgi:RNA binding exosome subunit